MSRGYYPQKFNFICLSCWMPTLEHCPEYKNNVQNQATCPLRRVARAKVTDEQVRQYREASSEYPAKYQLRHFVWMVELQADGL